MRQIGADVEHIFIDGASTDDTVEIISRNAAPPSIVVSEPDKGIYDAMNKGLSLATHDIVGILNADDYYARDNILSLVGRSFDKHQCRCVFGDVEFFKAASPENTVRTYNSGVFSPPRLLMGIMPAHPATFFRRSVYQEFGTFKTDYKIAADFEFIVRTLGRGRVDYVYLPDILVRMQTGGVSSRNPKSRWILNREILQALRENNLPANPFYLAAKIPFRLRELMR